MLYIHTLVSLFGRFGGHFRKMSVLHTTSPHTHRSIATSEKTPVLVNAHERDLYSHVYTGNNQCQTCFTKVA